jgi:predicted ATP-binding protein involved in virulence
MKLKLKLNRIEFENFRLFDKLDLTFDEQLTVLIGENGGGKTALLEGIAQLLTLFTDYIYSGKFPTARNMYVRSDIRDKQAFALNSITTSITQNDELPHLKCWKLRMQQEPNRMGQPIGLEWLSDLRKSLLKDSVGWVFNNPIPVMVYYPIERVTTVRFRSKEGVYDDALNGKALNINAFLDWFVWKEDVKSTDKPVFMAVKKAILNLLNEDEMPLFKDIYTYRSRRGDYRLMLEKGETNIEFNQLSSGEKSLFMLVADLARRLALANPYTTDALSEGQGIVLIDEIDLHLHPSWQRKIISKLRMIFPNIQWVITTDSPQVLMNVKRENVKVIRNGKIEASPFVEGRDANALSTDVFGLTKRLPYYEQLLDNIYNWIDKGETNQAQLAAIYPSSGC